MHLHPTHEILASFPYGALPAPETWRHNTRPAGWMDRYGAEIFWGEWGERFLEDEVVLSPELDAAYDRAIDAAFAKVAATLQACTAREWARDLGGARAPGSGSR
jgi:hypothetical protein